MCLSFLFCLFIRSFVAWDSNLLILLSVYISVDDSQCFCVCDTENCKTIRIWMFCNFSKLLVYICEPFLKNLLIVLKLHLVQYSIFTCSLYFHNFRILANSADKFLWVRYQYETRVYILKWNPHYFHKSYDSFFKVKIIFLNKTACFSKC